MTHNPAQLTIANPELNDSVRALVRRSPREQRRLRLYIAYGYPLWYIAWWLGMTEATVLELICELEII
jgi:hypothetical protein